MNPNITFAPGARGIAWARSACAALAASMTFFALAGCGGKKESASKGADNGEKKVVIYCSHPLDFTKPLVAEFEKQSGIKVEIIAAGTGELLKRIESEKAHPLGDILWGGALGLGSRSRYFSSQLTVGWPLAYPDEMKPDRVSVYYRVNIVI